MAQFRDRGAKFRSGPHPEDPGRDGDGLLHPYPAGKLEREQAVLDLADAAQAATRAAILLERGDTADPTHGIGSSGS